MSLLEVVGLTYVVLVLAGFSLVLALWFVHRVLLVVLGIKTKPWWL